VATGRRQTRLVVVAVETIPIAVVVVFVGREQCILARTDGMMIGIVLAAAAQPSTDAKAFASEMIVALRAAKRASRAVYPKEEQAREKDVHERFGDCLHG